MLRIQTCAVVLGLIIFTGARPASAQTNGLPAGLGAMYSLDQFGPVNTPAAAEQTFRVASREIIAAGGGVIVLPVQTASGWTPKNDTQEEWRKPEPPQPAKGWGQTVGVTVIDARGPSMKIQPPQVNGLEINRTLNLPPGESLPFWGYYPMLSMKNTIVEGSTSYRDWLQEAVEAGKDRRFYVPTIRGIFPGMFMSIGEWGVVQRLWVKSIGYDKESKRWYFVADTEADQPKGAIMGNKNHVSILNLETYSHNENQTFDVRMWRHNYSQGDNYLIDARFKYMGDVHSTAGDENGVIYAAFIESDTDIFRGKVESWNSASNTLVYQGSSGATLGTGRPVINLNPTKWITNGTVMIVRPANWSEEQNDMLQGKRHPTASLTNHVGIPSRKIGGLIHFPADSPVSEDVVGRYFAVDEKDEYVPKGASVRRWYLIDSVRKNPDGTKDLEIVRHWWGAKAAGSPTLYKPENYSSDQHPKPLHYIIAPGANVYDVSQGVNNPNRTIKLVPSSFTDTPLDFAPNDPLEQAIGPDPAKPIPFRSWMWDEVPGGFPSPVFDIGNMGIMRDVAFLIHGNASESIEKQKAERYDRSPPWDKYMSFEATCNTGIRFAADTGDAAILFAQPHNRPQPIKWYYAAAAESRLPRTASLTVTPEDGVLTFTGGGAHFDGPIMAKGLSGSDTPAHNLRGVDVPVKAGDTSVEVIFPTPEADGKYGVFIEQSWVSNRAVMKKTATGFTIKFAEPAPIDATVDWMIVR